MFVQMYFFLILILSPNPNNQIHLSFFSSTLNPGGKAIPSHFSLKIICRENRKESGWTLFEAEVQSPRTSSLRSIPFFILSSLTSPQFIRTFRVLPPNHLLSLSLSLNFFISFFPFDSDSRINSLSPLPFHRP